MEIENIHPDDLITSSEKPKVVDPNSKGGRKRP